MMGEMAEDGVGDHDAARILRHGSAANFERPRRGQMFVSRRLESAAGIRDRGVEAGEKLRLFGEGFGAKAFGVGGSRD